MKRVALATVILSAVALTALAQTPRGTPAAPTPTVVVSGRVLVDATSDPLPNARVTLVTSALGAPVVLTDRDGRFSFATPPGRQTVTANKTGYSRKQITVTAGEQPLAIRLSRGAVISGRVVDEFGDPIIGTRVVAETAAQAPAKGFVAAAAAFTDDRGEYRMGSLAADTFFVNVMTRGAVVSQNIGGGMTAMIPSSVTSYYPGVTAVKDAEGLRLQPGDERPSIDFAVTGGKSISGPYIISGPLPGAPAPPDTPPLTGIIRGRVVATDGRAAPRAEVRITIAIPAPAPAGTTLTGNRFRFQPISVTADDDGRFEFRGLPAGSFQIGVTKAGYSMPGDAVSFGFPAPGAGLTVKLADGETRERADVTLARWGSIEGHALDELGDPLQGVNVQVMQMRYQAGRRRLAPAGGAARLTDDLGRFRIYGMAPGGYIVSATIGDVGTDDLPGYTRSYYPGTANASQAQFVSVGLSQQMTGADFSLSRVRTANVSGTILNAAGEPAAGGAVRLVPSQRSASVTSVSVGARLLPDGRFEFPNVTPGQYIIQADRGRRNKAIEGEFGVLPIAVDGTDLTGLILQTSAGSSITGRVLFDSYSGATAPPSSQVEITPVPIDPDQSPMSAANADIHADWSFQIAGVNGPRRLQVTRTPAGWTLKEIRVRGIDVTDRPLVFGTAAQSLADVEVVLTDRITQVSGTISDDHAKPAPGSHLVLFSMDRDRWYPASRYLRLSIAKADGTIGVSGLPPGSYYAAAVAQLPTDGDDAWQEPAYLESLMRRATSIALGDGQQQVLNLKLP